MVLTWTLIIFMSIFLLISNGCATKISTIKWTPPLIGTLEFDLAIERKRALKSENDIVKLVTDNVNPMIPFSEHQFAMAKPPKGCKAFQAGKFKDFNLKEDAYRHIKKNTTKIKSDTTSLAIELYEAPTFYSSCGSEFIVNLIPDSKINGWSLSQRDVKHFESIDNLEIPFKPGIFVVAIEKSKFKGYLKPTISNLLMSRHKFEILPNYDTLVADPIIGTSLQTYSYTFENVVINGERRDIYVGGIVRYYTGEKFIYLVELVLLKPQTTDEQWNSYIDYLNSFRYLKADKVNSFLSPTLRLE